MSECSICGRMTDCVCDDCGRPCCEDCLEVHTSRSDFCPDCSPGRVLHHA